MAQEPQETVREQTVLAAVGDLFARFNELLPFLTDWELTVMALKIDVEQRGGLTLPGQEFDS